MEFLLLKHTGSAELMSVKALSHIKTASAVYYDCHTDKELLELLPENCPVFSEWDLLWQFIGQYEDKKAMQVIRMTEERDSNYGREMEELAFARSKGFATGTIPGVSNVIRLSARFCFPLTIRNRNEGFWVWDGTSGNEAATMKMAEGVAGTAATMVLLNPSAAAGVIIAQVLLRRTGNTPVLLITREEEDCLVTLQELQAISPDCWLLYHLVIIDPAGGRFDDHGFSALHS